MSLVRGGDRGEGAKTRCFALSVAGRRFFVLRRGAAFGRMQRKLSVLRMRIRLTRTGRGCIVGIGTMAARWTYAGLWRGWCMSFRTVGAVDVVRCVGVCSAFLSGRGSCGVLGAGRTAHGFLSSAFLLGAGHLLRRSCSEGFARPAARRFVGECCASAAVRGRTRDRRKAGGVLLLDV